MEQNENVDAEYLRGFNDGYLLAKHQPDISKSINALKGNNERVNSFSSCVCNTRYITWEMMDLEKIQKAV